MSITPTPSDAERRRLAEAAAWRVHLAELNQDTNEAFEDWLSDPANAAAWEQVQSSWALFDTPAVPELIDVRQAALADARRVAARRWQLRGTMRNAGLIAATIVLVAAAALATATWWSLPTTYHTALGERRVITLEDGSRLSLDSASEVEVSFGERVRDLKLLRGQARFDVAKDVERPFSVTASERKVIATGTAFNVDLTGRELLVTLIEGHVVVVDAGGSALPSAQRKPVELTPGQQLSVAPSRALAVASVDIERATAWERGQLMFDNERLSSVVARINRYSQTKVAVDGAAANLRISGVFNTGDVEGFVDTVTRYLPLEASREPQAVHLRARP